MTRSRWEVLDEKDLSIPRWGCIALAARTVRRVQPLFLAAWPTASIQSQLAVEDAVAEAELAASQAATTPALTFVGRAAMEVYGSRPEGVAPAGYVAYAAAHASFNARSTSARGVAFVIGEAMMAVHIYDSECDASGVFPATADAVRGDLKLLIEASLMKHWDENTPVPPTFFGTMWPDGPPKSWPAHSDRQFSPQVSRRSCDFDVQQLGLPSDLVEFLQCGKRLEYDPSRTEARLVVLKPYSHLRPDQFYVTTEGTAVESQDPHGGEDGYYIVNAVDLVGECDNYDPVGILAWLPEFRCYGCWDIDHGKALVFPTAAWTDIVANPPKFIDAQWSYPSELAGIAEDMRPWEHSIFRLRDRPGKIGPKDASNH
jgi:hypothetical protein